MILNSSKNILFVTSAAPPQTPFSTTEKRPPLGIGFLISVLRDAGHFVSFIDNYLSPNNFLETNYLAVNHIDFVGIYANTICFRDTLRMIYKLEYLRQTGQWSGKIILGGPHTTVAPETIPSFVDYLVQGEGEQAIVDIVSGKVTERILRYPRIIDLDTLPMPAWDVFTPLPYSWTTDLLDEAPVFTMNTSRGCPFNCSFCSVCSIWGKKYTYFSAERIVQDIEYLITHFGAKGIYFREDNFTVNRKRLEKFCNLLIEKKIDIKWACETRVNTIDDEIVELMYRAGARAFYFGVESGSQRILDELHKGITLDEIKDAFRVCHQYQIKTAASIIVGVPGETDFDRTMTEDLLREIAPTLIWYNVFVGIPDSDLYKQCKDSRLFEFIDDRGLGYLPTHNEFVNQYYNGAWDAENPLENANPCISVVMSVYNDESHVNEAVKSILNQSFVNFEFIIIDDCSTDNTLSVLQSISDSRIRIIRNNKNLGLTKSLNIGMRAAKGKYIARMDSDDISLSHRLQTLYDFLEKNADYVVAGSSSYIINDSGDITRYLHSPCEDHEIRSFIRNDNPMCHGSIMMRKVDVMEIGGYDENYMYSQDYELWTRLFISGKGYNFEEPLYCWREHASSITFQKNNEQRKYANMVREIASSMPLLIHPEIKSYSEIPENVKSLLDKGDMALINHDWDSAINFFTLAYNAVPAIHPLSSSIKQIITHIRSEAVMRTQSNEKQNDLPKMELSDYILKADQMTGEGRIDDAITLLRDCIDRYPQEVDVLKLLSILYTRNGDLQNAEIMLRVAIKLDPQNAELVNMYGTLLFQQGRYRDSKVLFERALGLNPDSEEIRSNLDYVIEAIQQQPAATQKPAQAPQPAQNNSITNTKEYQVQIAENELGKGNVSVAKDILVNLVQRYPDDFELTNAAGSLSLQCGEIDRALDFYNRAILIRSNAPEGYANCAGVYHYMHLDKIAAAFSQTALSHDCTDIQSLTILARVADKTGDRTAASNYYQQLLIQSPENEEAHEYFHRAKNHASGYSFCIITNGKRPGKLARELESIRTLKMPAFEILIAGELPEGLPADGFQFFPMKDAADHGRLGEMRNRLVEAARMDHIVVMDDDLFLHPDFYRGLTYFGEDFDVMCVRLLNPDGSRYWDWATSGGPTGHHLLRYDEQDSWVYVTGGFCIMKSHVGEHVQWSNSLEINQAEDADFSRRLHQAGYLIKFNPYSTVTHDDPRCTQAGKIIVPAVLD
jgi:radical SAM superfamily enzyme YgiQ (UPF0313 family)/GT2 family glycosyltransferase/Tfp pilus assembly protein PilF